MSALIRIVLVVVVVLPTIAVVAQFEKPSTLHIPLVEAPIETIGLFKNGLAVVRRTVKLPSDGAATFDIADLPEPVHGTFWIESTVDIRAQMTTADLPIGDDQPLPGMDNASLAGAAVTIYFKEQHLPKVSGVVVAKPEVDRQWDRRYGSSRPHRGYWWSGLNNSYNNLNAATATNPATLVVRLSNDANAVIDAASIAYVQIDEEREAPTKRQSVMRLTVGSDESDAEPQISMLYLAKGASWAPSYAIDITDPSQLELRQKAVVRNELADIQDAEILLISGFPNIEFGHVLSPLAPASDMASFFRALGTINQLSHSSRGDVMGQTVMYNSAAPNTGAESAGLDHPSLTGDDLHYHSIGRHSLAVGDTLMVETGRATTDYERIVRWTIPDDRDAWGRRRQAHYQYNTGETMEGVDPYDALRFVNPIDRPLTTAPAMIVRDGFVRGQSMMHWTTSGERIVLDINKALSVRARAEEIELEDQRSSVTRWGVRYRETVVQGTLQVANYRAEAVTLVAQVEFSGELIESEGEPRVELRPEGVWTANPRREMIWTLQLEPGESRDVEYRYRVLVRH